MVASAAIFLILDDGQRVGPSDAPNKPIVDFAKIPGKLLFGFLKLLGAFDDFGVDSGFFSKEPLFRVFEKLLGFGEFGFDRREFVGELFGLLIGFERFVVQNTPRSFVGLDLELEGLIFLVGLGFGELGFPPGNRLIAGGDLLFFFFLASS